MRTIFHIDANSAYLSWTAVDLLEKGYPIDVRTVPSVIAGNPESRQGIILTKSIPAKAYGIKTGESLYEARKKCPDVLAYPPDYDLYMSCSDAMYDILSDYSDLIERYSVDECWIDYTASLMAKGDPFCAAWEISERIKNELGFTVNIGVSCNKLLAKMGSELKKPDRIHTLYPDEIANKMWPLPVSELFYVGRATTRKLLGHGIRTIGQLSAMDEELVKAILKPSHGRLVWEYANGIDDTPVQRIGTVAQKGVGNSTTTPYDVTEREDALMFLLALTERVSHRLRKLMSHASIVHISIRRSDMTFSGKQRKLGHYIGTTDEIYTEAVRLLDELWQGEPLRHLGVHVSGLMRTDRLQISIYDRADAARLAMIDEAVESIREAFGKRSIMRGIFVSREFDPIQGGVNDGNYLLMGGHRL